MAKNEVVIKFLGDTSGYDKAAGQVAVKTQSLGKTVAGVFGGIQADRALQKVVEVGGEAINMARDLAENQSKVNTVFGGMSASVSEYAKAADAIGLSDNAALQALGTFGNLFDQLGVGSSQSASMSKALVGLAADLGSFHNADITEVIEAQTSAFRGEYDSLQRFIPTINAAAVEQKALAMTGKATTKELTAQEKALAVQALMLEGAGKAVGDFERTSGGLANKQRQLSAQWDDMKTKLGGALTPALTKLTSVGLGVVDFFSKLSPEAQTAIGVIAGLVGVAFLIVKATQAWTAAQAALNIVMAMNPIGLVVLAIAALVAGLVLAWNNCETFRNVVKAVFENVKLVVTTAIGHVRGVIEGLGKVLSTVWNGFRDGAKAVFNAVAKLWNNTIGKISFKVPSWVPGIGGKGFSVPNIPVMHDGGVFHAPTRGGEGLALLEDGERVVSRKDSAGWGGGITINISTGQVLSTERDVAEAVRRAVEYVYANGGAIGDGRGGYLRTA